MAQKAVHELRSQTSRRPGNGESSQKQNGNPEAEVREKLEALEKELEDILDSTIDSGISLVGTGTDSSERDPG